MATVKERFDELCAKRDEAKTTQVQLQTRIDTANETLKNIEDSWKENYGLNDVHEVENRIAQLEEEINGTLTKCEEYLSKVGV